MSTMDARIESVRRFNRFYTKAIGVLPERHLGSPMSLAEVRVLYELAHREEPTATALAAELELDAGYLSRILRRFEQQGIVKRKPSAIDARQTLLALTAKGRKTFQSLDARARGGIGTILGRLSDADQVRLENAMRTIEEVLGEGEPSRSPVVLRAHRPGDIGWVVQRHGELYAQEYGWDERFEALVSRIMADFVDHFDPKRERCWIAEQDGERVGCVFLVKKSETVAKLRCLLVEPKARGLGIGSKLVDECERFARQAGYRKIILWTNSVLDSARRIYARAGYRVIKEEPHHEFGEGLVGETWEKKV